jgi:hypothetical protein
MLHFIPEPLRHWIDGLFITIATASFLQIINNLSGVLAFIYLGLRIWEMDTVRGWRGLPPKKD